jgi:uncharacterized protein (TIGR02271 family)
MNIDVARVRPGTRVVCADGEMGVVRDAAPGPATAKSLRVDAGGAAYDVPVDLVRSVGDDGVFLECTRAEAEAHRVVVTETAEPSGADTLELREERLVVRKERTAATARVGVRVEEFPRRLVVDVEHDDVQVERVPVGREVPERLEPWEEDGVLVIPVYEEQHPVPRRLTLVEEVRVRRVPITEQQVVEETLRRERLVVDDPTQDDRSRP